ncbi:MAG TPA: hypothetical protein PKM91_08655 [Cyclobacteriaceae bacterium]|nr:hypothetical protein [Cyclobacteriaceae bacterium]
MADTLQKPESSDEISLSKVFQAIGDSLISTGRSLLLFLAILRSVFFSNKVFFGIIVTTGVLLGITYSEALTRKYYKSTMILSCDYLNREIISNSIDKLNLLAGEPDREGLSNVLHISVETAKNIRKFETKAFISETDIVEMEVLKEQLNNVVGERKELVKKVIERLELDNKSAFRISTLIYDPTIVANLDSALVAFFYSNSYVKRRVEINRSNLKFKKEKLIEESRKLDSLKSLLMKNFDSMAKQTRQNSNNVILTDKYMFDPMSVFREGVRFYDEIQEIDRKLYIQPDFEVIDGFTSFKEPESVALPLVIVYSIVISILIGYLILGGWHLDKYLSALYKG